MSDLSAEQWRPVVGYEGYYEVSDLGRVRSVDRVIWRNGYAARLRGRILKQWADPNGRMQVRLGRGEMKRAHTLVLEAFIGPRPDGQECCHNDGDPTNNRLLNLRWDSHSENQLDQSRHGTQPQRNRTHCPRDHALVDSNVVASFQRRGHRTCLACARARAAEQRAHKRGEPFDLNADADARYADIMGTRPNSLATTS